MLVSASTEIKIHKWPISAEHYTYTPQESSKINCLSVSSDNSFIAYVTANGKAEIILVKNKDLIKAAPIITTWNDISVVSFQNTTKRNLIIGTKSALLALYNINTKSIIKTFPGISAGITQIVFNCKDSLLAVACQIDTIFIYNLENGIENAVFLTSFITSPRGIPSVLRFHPIESKVLAAGTDEGTVNVWDIGSTRKVFIAQTHSSLVSGLVIAESSDLLISVGYDHKVCIHDLIINECVFRSSLQNPLTAVDISPDGYSVAIGAEDGTIYIYDLRNLMQSIVTVKVHSSPITKLIFESKPKEFVELPSVLSQNGTTLSEGGLNLFRPKSNIDKLLNNPHFIPEQCKTVKDDNFSMVTFKEHILNSVQRETDFVRDQMLMHMNGLHSFICNEFKKIEAEMDDKWEVLNFASTQARSTVDFDIPDEELRSRSELSDGKSTYK